MATVIDTQYIKQIAATIVDARLLQLREDVYGPGVTYAPFIPISSLPPTVVNGDLDALVGDYGYIKHVKVYSGGSFKGDVKELDFLNASVIVAGDRAFITISGRGIIDAGVNNNTPFSNVGHLNFTVGAGSLMNLGASYDSGTNKATIVFDITPHQLFEGTYEDLGHVMAGSGLLVNNGILSVDPTVLPSGLSNPMTSLGDIIYGGVGGTPLRRGIGSELTVLTVSGGVPTWQSAQTLIGSGVAPTNAKYVVTEAHAGLSNEIIIPGFAGHGDIQGFGGGGTEYEFDSGASPFTWDTTPSTIDVNTTAKSHLWIATQGGNSGNPWLGWTAWAPAGLFDIRAKVSTGADNIAGGSIGLQVYNSDNSRRLMMYLVQPTNDSYRIDCYSYNGSYSFVASTAQTDNTNFRYLRIRRLASDVIRFYHSIDGITWSYLGTTTFSITVARMGLYLSSPASGANEKYYAIDWIRADV